VSESLAPAVVGLVRTGARLLSAVLLIDPGARTSHEPPRTEALSDLPMEGNVSSRLPGVAMGELANRVALRAAAARARLRPQIRHAWYSRREAVGSERSVVEACRRQEVAKVI
jgi:hypothetical protein